MPYPRRQWKRRAGSVSPAGLPAPAALTGLLLLLLLLPSVFARLAAGYVHNTETIRGGQGHHAWIYSVFGRRLCAQRNWDGSGQSPEALRP